jgi:hypothetical protein
VLNALRSNKPVSGNVSEDKPENLVDDICVNTGPCVDDEADTRGLDK